jgi:hypothetical protein
MTDCNNNKNNNNKSISTTALATAIPTTFIPSTSKYNLILNYKDHLSILFLFHHLSKYTKIKYDGCLQRYLKQFVPDYKQKVEWLRRNTESLLI